MKKRLIALVLTIGMSLSMVACGEKSPNAPADNAAAEDTAASVEDTADTEVQTANPDAAKVINVAVGSFATSSVVTAKELYEAEHSDVSINIVEIPFGNLYEKLCTSFATNTAAYDIVIYPSNWLAEFIQGNSVIALDDYLTTKDNWDTIVDAYKGINAYEGKNYSVPLDGDSIILYYRKDAFENEDYKAQFKEKYGRDLTVPVTWDEYIECAEFFNGWDWDGDGELEYGTIEAMAPKDVGGYIFLTHALTYAAHPDYTGYAFFDYETLEPMVNSPAYLKALEEYKQILKLGPPNMINYGGGDERAAFAAGEAAMAIDWHDTAVMAQDVNESKIKDNVGYALVPGSREVWNPETKQWDTFDEVQYAPFLAFSGWTSSITSSCQNPQDAADFLNVLDSDEVSMEAVTTPGTARNPYREEHLTNSEAWENSVSKFVNPQEFLDVVMESYTHPNHQLDMRLPKAGSYLDAIDTAVSQALAGDISNEKALQGAYDAWQEITDDEDRDTQITFYQNTYLSDKK